MAEYTIVLSDNSSLSVPFTTIQKYPTISNIINDLEQTQDSIPLPYDDPSALKIVLIEDFYKNSYAMNVFIRLLKAINYLGDDNILKQMINKMRIWPQRVSPKVKPLEVGSGAPRPEDKQMVRRLQGLSEVITSHLQTLPPELIYDLLELKIRNRYTIPLSMGLDDELRIYSNSKGDIMIIMNHYRTWADLDSHIYLFDGQTGKQTDYAPIGNVYTEIVSLANDGRIHILYYLDGLSHDIMDMDIVTATTEDTLVYGIIDKDGHIQSTELGQLKNLTAENADNIHTQLSTDGSQIFIKYFIKSEDESLPGKDYYKIINSTNGQLIWSGFTFESLYFLSLIATDPSSLQLGNFPIHIMPTIPIPKEQQHDIIRGPPIIFPSPQLTAVIIHQHRSGEYSINLRDGRSITISNPQITGMFDGPSPNLNVPTILTYDINNILFSPRETHLLETTAIGTPPKMPSIVPITDSLEVGPVTEENKFYTSRLITIEGQILLSHKFDKTWPLALGQNYIITKDVIENELVLRIWPMYYFVDNDGHIKYGIDKKKVLFQKKGMDLLSIHVTADNIVHIVYRASDTDFMEDTMDTWISSFKINVYNDLDQYVLDLTGL